MNLRPDSCGNTIFAIMPDSSVTLPTLPDVGWVPEFNIAATTSGFDGRDLELL
jgi:hypothetical protein